MSLQRSIFIFGEHTAHLNDEQDHIGCLPSDLSDRGKLFAGIQQALLLPDYFGANWDALEECLCDLGWIERRRVALLHKSLPLLNRESLTIYLEILSESVQDWTPDKDHELLVIFPEDAKRTIDIILSESRVDNGDNVSEG